MEPFQAAIERFDAENARDPNQEIVAGSSIPRELLQARRLTDWVERLAPDASEVLRLAARCQHLCRWEIPRASQPMTRAGYLKWRHLLKQYHADKAGGILHEVGYPEDAIARVQALNRKDNFPKDPESRVLEDALCLVFLQYQLAEFASRTDHDKVVNALRKSWLKMTPRARREALKLPFGVQEQDLIKRALASLSSGDTGHASSR
jgi:hypothetical protein